MNYKMTSIFIIFAAGLMIAIAILLIWNRIRNRKTEESGRIFHTAETRLKTPVQGEGISGAFSLMGPDGIRLLHASEITCLPKGAQTLQMNGPAVNRIIHLASDLFKGVASIPGKHIELVFSPNVQQGLRDGTYKLMQSAGQNLADAVKVNTKGLQPIVGKGRIVESGKARQLAGGVFQLLSIAVAQSHLADINKSLNHLQQSVDSVLKKMEITSQEEIRGAIAYLQDLAKFMEQLDSPEHLPQTKRQKLEDINYEFHKWRGILISEMKSLLSKVKNQEDLDTFGTGETYQALKTQITEAEALNERHELLLTLAGMFNLFAAYLDPLGKQLSRTDPKISEWLDLSGGLRLACEEKTNQLIKSAIFNQKETLEHRRRDVLSCSQAQFRLAEQHQVTYENVKHRLDNGLHELISDHGEIRVALAFDQNGKVTSAALTPTVRTSN